MKRRLVALMVVGLVLALAGMAYLLLVRARQSTPVVETLSLPSGEAGPVALVKIAAVKKGAIQETIRVYGTVIPAPGATNALSVPYESRVHRIMVNEGQEVSPGDPLLEIGPSPETRLKFDQAAESYNTARQALQNMERKFKLKLATNDQVLQAKQASDQAGLNLESMKRQGVDGVHEMKAQAKGLVSRVAVDQGAIVAAGAPLMLVVPENRFELRLGVEPTDIGRVHTGHARCPLAGARPGGPCRHRAGAEDFPVRQPLDPARRRLRLCPRSFRVPLRTVYFGDHNDGIGRRADRAEKRRPV